MIEYDLHVHYESIEDIIEIVRIAERLNLKLIGLVTHLRNSIKKKVDIVSDVEILWGIEVKYPIFSSPKGYDYMIVHLEDLQVTSEIIRRLKGDIIAHPTSYGVIWTEDSLEEVKSREFLMEFNASHYRSSDNAFYDKLKELGIKIVYGSDAHTPTAVLSYPHPSYVLDVKDILDLFKVNKNLKRLN